jgi:hypothetical protein
MIFPNVFGPITRTALLLSGLVACTDATQTLTGVSTPPEAPAPDLVATSAVALPAAPAIINVTYPVVTGRQWYVRAGDNLQTALNNAQRGDEVVLQAGATFTGHFTLPQKSGTVANGWITVRSDKLSLMPSGIRVTPAKASLMAKIVTPNVEPAIRTAVSASASGWYLAGIEVTVVPTLTIQQYGLVYLGDGSGKQYSLSLTPSNLVLDRVYIHGHPTTMLTRCVSLNSARTAIINSYLSECHLKGMDSQAIAGWNGPGPYKIVNNTLMGAGENIMFGGADPAIPNLIPSDIEIRNNYLYTPATWKGVWTKKNLFELKNAQRVLLESNVLDGSWIDGQVGTGILLKSVNQSGRCTWCKSGDITIRNNLMRNVGQPFNLAGHGSANPVGAQLGRVLIENMVVEKVNVWPYNGDPRFILLIAGVHDVTIRRNTMTTSANFSTFTTIGSGVSNLVMDSNIFRRGNYGLMADGGYIGSSAMNRVAGTKAFTNNVIVGTVFGTYPTSTKWVSLLSSALTNLTVGASTTLASSLASIQIY